MSHSSRNPLPPELWDQIIDHLSNDPDSLAACALVCSSWLLSARCRLFRRITVPCHKLSKFHGVIIRHLEMASYIKHLIVYCSMPWTGLPSCMCYTRKRHTRLWALLAELPNLRALRLQGGYVWPTPSVIHTLEVIELDGVFISSFADLHQWLSAFPRLASFSPLVSLGEPLPSKGSWHSALSRLAESFNPTMWLNKTPSEKPAPPLDPPQFTVSPTLSSVRLFWHPDLHRFTERISEQLIAHGIPKNLRQLSLHLRWFSNQMPPSTLSAFVGSLGPPLTHLEIGAMLLFPFLAKLIEAGHPSTAECGDLSFSNCPNLTHIRILDGWGGYINENSARELSTWAPHFLSGLRCPRVATICFTMGIHTTSCSRGWGTMVDQFLSVTMANKCFGNLARVVFELYGNPPPSSWCRDFEAEVNLYCDEIAAGWRGHLKLGIVYEIVLDDELKKKFVDGRCIGWDEKDSTGIPLRVRMMRTSCDDEDPRLR